jgi:GABA permease
MPATRVLEPLHAVPPCDLSTRSAGNLLVIANETLAGAGMAHAVDTLSAEDASVLVVCPVLISRSRYWTSDLSDGIERAAARLRGSLESLRARGIDAEGLVGDGHPLLATEDALRCFPADHLLIVTHPPQRSNWLERRLISRARSRFALPISHVVVDLDRESI